MSDLDGIVNITITGAAPQVSEPGFGTPMIVTGNVPGGVTASVTTYTAASQMTTDGYGASHPAFLKAQVMFSQTPPVARVKVAARHHVITQVVHLTPADPATVNGLIYSVLIDGLLATITTSGGHNTLAEVCTDLATAINALAGAPVTADGTSGTHVVCTGAAGVLHSYAFVASITGTIQQAIKIFDATTDAGGSNGLNDDLTRIDLADGDWYFLLLDSDDIAGVNVARAYMAARGFGEFCTQTADTGNASTGSVLDPASTTDFLYLLKHSTPVARVWAGYTPGILTSMFAAGMVGSRATSLPGSDTWWGKTLAGVTAYALSPSAKAAVCGTSTAPTSGKNGNVYMTVAGIDIVQNGMMSNGDWADAVRGIDWLKQQLQLAVFLLLIANGGKVPYTDAGGDLIGGAIRSVLKAGIKVGLLNPGAPKGVDGNGTPYPAIPAPSVYVPPVASVPVGTRATRNFPGFTFAAQGAGAIQGVSIVGGVS